MSDGAQKEVQVQVQVQPRGSSHSGLAEREMNGVSVRGAQGPAWTGWGLWSPVGWRTGTGQWGCVFSCLMEVPGGGRPPVLVPACLIHEGQASEIIVSGIKHLRSDPEDGRVPNPENYGASEKRPILLVAMVTTMVKWAASLPWRQ